MARLRETTDGLPPRWLESMRERRACLYRYRCPQTLTDTQAESVALELAKVNGTGRWDCSVVCLDGAGRDWEFRFKPRLARVVKFRSRTLS